MKRLGIAKPSAQTGLSLVELMVALVISMIVSLAVFATMISMQQQTKITNAVNSRSQAGAFALHQLDLLVRNAGNGLLDYSNMIASIGTSSYGCLLHAAKNGQTLLPAASTLSAPFSAINGQLRLAPLLIKNGDAETGDFLSVMQSASGLSNLPSQLLSPAQNAALNVNNLLAYQGDDRVLVVGDNLQPCLVSQVESGFSATAGTATLPLAGNYYQQTISGVALSTANQFLVNLGQSPKFLLLGVSSQDHHLYQYDLLEPANNSVSNTNPSVFIENVVSLQAIYGVDPDGDGNLTDLVWVAPTGSYDYSVLSTDPASIGRIKAVKVAIILRADARDAKVVSNNTLTVFADTTIPLTVTMPDTHYRYKAFETTIPIRNSLL